MKEDRFEGWCRNTEMEFSVINHRDPSLSIVKREAHAHCSHYSTASCEMLGVHSN